MRFWRAAFASDYTAISAATTQIREGFRESAAVNDASQIASLCDEALDAAEFIKANVAQARLTDRGTYRARTNWFRAFGESSSTLHSADERLRFADMKIDDRHGSIVAEMPTTCHHLSAAEIRCGLSSRC